MAQWKIQMQKTILPGGATPGDYTDIDQIMFNSYLKWHKGLKREWGRFQDRVSIKQMIAWSTAHSERNIERARVPTSLRKKVLDRDRHHCRYCMTPLRKESQIHFDHVHPFSKGGETVFANLVASCGSCNKRKSYLHDIQPFPIVADTDLEVDISARRTNAIQSRERLFKHWDELSKDPRQHNLEAESFFAHYRRISTLTSVKIEVIASKKPRKKIDQYYDLDWWISAHLRKLIK